MKQFLKSTLCNISYAVNLPKFLGPFGKNKIIVLMYHGIVKSYSQNPLKNIYGYNISKRQFEDQIAYLSKYCNVIKASEAIAGKRIPHDRKNVIITFDDGYRNNYTNAFPILLKYNLPALFSLPTAFIVNKTPLWHDIIEYAVTVTTKESAHIKWDDIYLNFTRGTTSEKIEFIKWLTSKCVDILQEEREQFIAAVLNELGISLDNNKIFVDPDYEPLTPEEIKIMSESGLAEFASHSARHYILSRLNKDILINELTTSKSAIEQITGTPCRYICIPGGYYNSSVISEILNAKYEKIFSSDETEFEPGTTTDIISRYCIYKSTNMPLFADIVHGPFHRISYMKRHK